jgi:very-short-patch-repair endonuclease
VARIYNSTTQRDARRQLRKAMPPAEALLWSKLRAKQSNGLKFRLQYGVGPYILDFYCPALKLAIEIDGDSHYQDGSRARDHERQAYFESFDIRLLRFTNVDVYNNLNGVTDRIATTAEEIRRSQRERSLAERNG